jgi:DNA-binding SARP family transcriptional activator
VESHVSLVLLGGFQVRVGSGDPLALSIKAQALLAYLAVRPGRRHSRDKLAALLWPSAGDEHARHSLRQTLVTLRRALGSRAIVIADHRDVALDDSAFDVDVVRFEALTAERSRQARERAVALYQGDLLDGIRVKEPPFDEWLLGERERLRELATQALTRLLDDQHASGLVEPAIRTAMRILTLDPANELAHRELMRLFDRQGRRGEALRQYRLCVDALQRELSVEPQAETRRLYREIVQAEQAPTARPKARATSVAARTATPAPELLGDPLRQTARLIGRHLELDRLGQTLDAVARGVGRLVVVVGEAGIGKTSLLEALETEAHRRGVRCHLGRSYPSEQVLAFAPWIDALRADTAGDPALVAALGRGWVEELARLFPDIEIGRPARTRDAAEPQRLFEAMARLVSCLAADQPRLVMLEDVHWADEMSVRLLAYVARRIGGSRALIVATAREEELATAPALSGILAELTADPRVDRMRLAALSHEDTTALVRALARAGTDARAVARLGEKVFRTSQGNPFVVVETMRALADGSMSEGAVGAVMPDRVRLVIAGRLDRLGERSRGLVAAAAVIGREFDFALLRDAAGLAAEAAAEEIETLVRRRVLRVAGERFDFVHDQVREVAYDQLLPSRRVLLHAAVFRAIEALHGPHTRDHVDALAQHAFRGELWDKAVAHGEQAGHIAAERSASAQASACFAQAIQALDRLPESREMLAQGIELRRMRTAHHFALGERAAFLDRIEEMVVLAERLGEELWLARVGTARANALWFAGDNRAALAWGLRAIPLAEAVGDAETLIHANLNLGLICNAVGDFRQAAAQFSRAAELTGGKMQRERLGRTLYPAVNARAELGRALADLGRFDAATAAIEEALGIAVSLQHSTTLLVARFDGGHVLLCRGDFDDAVPLLDACFDDLQAAGHSGFASGAAGMLGYARAMTGDPGDGVTLIRESIAHAAQGRRTREALFTTYLGEALLLAGQRDEASNVAARALTMSVERGERGTEARARYVRGLVAAKSGEGGGSAAQRDFRDALALAEELGMRPLVALCDLALARLARQRHDRPAHEEHLATAATMFRELGMPFWQARAAAEADAD